MITAGAEAGASAVMAVCNNIFGSVLIASFHSGTEVVGGCTTFDRKDQARWNLYRFIVSEVHF